MPSKEIFVVEDNEDIREVIDYILRDQHYHVKLFPTVKKFKSNMSHKLPDLIILDVMLPDGNGIDLCDELKKDDRTAHIPVLLMSAHYNRKELIGKVCAEDFISKPFDIDFFSSKIKEYIST